VCGLPWRRYRARAIRTKDQISLRARRYRLTETYLGTRDGDWTFESVGHWTILRGNKADPNGTIYQFSFDQPRDVRNFLRVSEDELRQLDRQQNEIESPVNLSLRRRQSGLVGGYAPADAADGRVRSAADFAMANEARRLDQIIRLEAIPHAERQIVTGTNYRFCLTVATRKASQSPEVVVDQNLKGQYSLTSWTEGHG
jgi:NlpE N-terminal domain